MRKPVAISGAVVTVAAGFAAAIIVSGGSLAAIAHNLTGTTWTRTVATTGTNPDGRKVLICRIHWGRHHRHHWFTRMSIDQHALGAHLRHGDRLAPCVPVKPVQPAVHVARHDDDDDGDGGHGHGGGTTTTTTTTAAIVAVNAFSGQQDKSHGNGRGHGRSSRHH
jgi:hypothetical protein